MHALELWRLVTPWLYPHSSMDGAGALLLYYELEKNIARLHSELRARCAAQEQPDYYYCPLKAALGLSILLGELQRPVWCSAEYSSLCTVHRTLH
jgi:hypothetical protein